VDAADAAPSALLRGANSCGTVVSMDTGVGAGRGSAPTRAEVIAALSLGIDLGLGQPMEHMLRAAVIAARLADRMGLDPDQRAVVYYADLVAWIGCHADSPELAEVFRDEIDFRAGTYRVDLRGLPRARFFLRRAAADRATLDRGRNTVKFMITGRRRMTDILESHYVSAGALADRLGLGARVRTAVRHTFERWDGTGLPQGVQGDAIPIEMRIVQLADVAEVHWREDGSRAAVDMARRRSGTQFDPDIVSVFDRYADEILAEPLGDDAWRAALALAPEWDRPLSAPDLDELLVALGDFVDLKSRFRHGHSRAVAALAGDAARLIGLPDDDVDRLRRAGAVHDLGRLGVSNSIWDKPTPLSSVERERVRLYPYLTQRILGRVTGLTQVAALAGAHRELLDGSGYPKGVDATFLSVPARILAAADRYQSLTESRPHRAALPAADAATALDRDALAGRLDPAAVAAVASVTSVAGHATRRRTVRPSGLTPREEEVLALAAVGRSSRDIAAELVISEKTVRNHLEHIYAKAGVSNRASASLFAVQHGIVKTAPDAGG
jgi:HD-GYP domain-containing protein (c-di-GMP phosphodiesterase class II)